MKSHLLALICSELRQRYERLLKAAQETHAAATDPGSKAEGKYDTRNLEASYLAAGQARQVAELAEALRIFENLVLEDFSSMDPIQPGALVEAKMQGETLYFLLVPSSGGLTIHDGEQEITLLTPMSDLYGKLLGKSPGDTLLEPHLSIENVS